MSVSRAYIGRLADLCKNVDFEQFDAGIELVRKAWLERRQVVTLGNGGSAITALHFITDWSKMVYLATGMPLRGRTLVDNIGLLTAYANDIGYADVFSEQLKNIAVRGDLVIAISGSGNSPNVLKAVTVANEIGCETLGLCGFSGGKLKELAKQIVWVQSNDMQLCEDVHSIFGHIVMQALCSRRVVT